MIHNRGGAFALSRFFMEKGIDIYSFRTYSCFINTVSSSKKEGLL